MAHSKNTNDKRIDQLIPSTIPLVGTDLFAIYNANGTRNDSLTSITSYVASNMTGVTSDTFLTGATLNSNTLEIGRNQGLSDVTVDLSPLITSNDTYVTGSTLSGNTLVISRNQGLPNTTVDLSNIVTGNGIFDVGNSGGTIPTAFDYTLTDSIQQNAANSYIKHEDREFAMVGTALGDRSYSISRSLANTANNGSVFMLNNAGLTDNDRVDFLLQNFSGGASSKTELKFRRANIGTGSGGTWIDFMMQSGINQNVYFNYNTNGSVPYGNVIVQNGNFVINNLGTGTSVTNLGIDAFGVVVTGTDGSSGGTSSGNLFSSTERALNNTPLNYGLSSGETITLSALTDTYTIQNPYSDDPNSLITGSTFPPSTGGTFTDKTYTLPLGTLDDGDTLNFKLKFSRGIIGGLLTVPVSDDRIQATSLSNTQLRIDGDFYDDNYLVSVGSNYLDNLNPIALTGETVFGTGFMYHSDKPTTLTDAQLTGTTLINWDTLVNVDMVRVDATTLNITTNVEYKLHQPWPWGIILSDRGWNVKAFDSSSNTNFTVNDMDSNSIVFDAAGWCWGGVGPSPSTSPENIYCDYMIIDLNKKI